MLNAEKAATAVTLAFVLAGCAADGKSGGNSFAEVVGRIQAGPQGQASVAATVPAELDGVFKRSPITNSQKPETWPRAAVTIQRATPGVYATVGLGDTASMKGDDCVWFKVRLWKSATEGKTFDGLKVCAAELYPRLKGVPMYQVPTWGRRAFFLGEKTTGSVRTEGPTPPNDLFITDPALQLQWLDNYKNTIFFVGGILHMMGYNWNDVNDKRVWFVSVPAKT